MRPEIHPEDFLHIKSNPTAAMRFFIPFGMVAPSNYNTQPWLFTIKENMIEVRGNPTRALPVSDENHRHLFISIGCAIENILIAADYYGLPVAVNYFPEQAEPMLVARIRFDRLIVPPTATFDEHHLIFAIAGRHNNRSEFDDRPVPADFLESLGRCANAELIVHVLTEPAERQAAAEVVVNATEAALRDQRFASELSHWMRPSLSRYRDGMPGYNLGTSWLASFIAPFAIRRGNAAKAERTTTEHLLLHAPTYVVLSTVGDDPRDWVTAGQTLERMWLMATAAGLKVGVFAAPTQVDDYYLKLQDVLKTPHHPQVFFRLGYAEKIPQPSPRLFVEEVIRP